MYLDGTHPLVGLSGRAINRNLGAGPVSDGRRGETIPAGRYLTGRGEASVMP
jgi:hypothetical protein